MLQLCFVLIGIKWYYNVTVYMCVIQTIYFNLKEVYSIAIDDKSKIRSKMITWFKKFRVIQNSIIFVSPRCIQFAANPMIILADIEVFVKWRLIISMHLSFAGEYCRIAHEA